VRSGRGLHNATSRRIMGGCLRACQQRIAGHSNAKTTGLYNRRHADINVGESGATTRGEV
jgi:hypothetical protein